MNNNQKSENFAKNINNFLNSYKTNFSSDFLKSKVNDRIFDGKAVHDFYEKFNFNHEFNIFMKQLFDNTIIINKEHIINVYTKHVDKIAKLVNEENYEIIIVTTTSPISKSNFWITMYVLNLLLNKNIIVKYAIDNIINMYKKCEKIDENAYVTSNICSNILNEITQNNKKPLLIFCDDISYSGTQLSAHISTGFDLTDERFFEKNDILLTSECRLYLCLIGITEESKKILLKSSSYNNNNKKMNIININELTIFNNTLNNFIDNFYKNVLLCHIDQFYITYNNDKYYINSMINKFVNIVNIELLMTMPIFKYPDGLSFVSGFCSVHIGSLINFNILKSSTKLKKFIENHFNDYKNMEKNHIVELPEDCIEYVLIDYSNKNKIQLSELSSNIKNINNIDKNNENVFMSTITGCQYDVMPINCNDNTDNKKKYPYGCPNNFYKNLKDYAFYENVKNIMPKNTNLEDIKLHELFNYYE
jgi:hypothetical protein